MRKHFILALFTAFSAVFSSSAQIAYKVEGNGLDKPSYLFGTHHLAPLSTIDATPGAREAFNSAESVVGEIDMTQDPMALAAAMQPHMMAPADSTLSNLFDATKFEAMNEQFKKYAPIPGADLKMFNAMKPMVVTAIATVGMVSSELSGFNPQEQLDTYFQTEGKAAGKEIIPLETAEMQAVILYDKKPIAAQAEALSNLLNNPGKSMESVKKLNSAYAAADLDALYSLSQEDDSDPEFFRILLDERNANWLKELPSIMKGHSSFIAVGALHLAGENGLVKGLRKLGYTVTPLK